MNVPKAIVPETDRVKYLPGISIILGAFLSGTTCLHTIMVYADISSGCMNSLSLIAIPVFLDTTSSATQLYHQWARMYHYGHQVLPAMALTTGFSYAYFSWRRRSAKRGWAVYTIAGIVTVLMIPFTLIFMVPTNDELFALEASTQKGVSAPGGLERAVGLVRTWSRLHLARCLFPLAGALIGMMAQISETRAV